jgi:predicted nucleic acid-binding protein
MAKAENLRPPSGERCILDTSVWQRLSQPVVRQAVADLQAKSSPWSLLVCPPVVAEVGFSARSGADHETGRHRLAEFPDCEAHPATSLVLDIQNALSHGGLVRAVGAVDTVIAAYAIANDARIVHYDSDFEHLARVRPRSASLLDCAARQSRPLGRAACLCRQDCLSGE